jgi:NAD(P)-dependent dehydrogenase (short-subunit alcohol dehydrogenase family)
MHATDAAFPQPPAAAPASRVALVTGAARRLGRHIALALARDGWDIGIHYADSEAEAHRTAAEVRALGRRSVCLAARLDDPDATLRLVPELGRLLGPVRVLINNASRFVHDDIATVDAQSLQAHLMPNLVAPLLLSRALLEQLPGGPVRPGADGAEGTEVSGVAAAGGEGVIVNLLDQKLYNFNPDFLSYTVAKAGLAAAVVMLAQAMAPRVRVVGVAPGLTLPSYLQDEESFRRAQARFSLLGRSSTPQDVAAAVVFAVGNRSLTGTVLQVDGGQHLTPLPRDASLMPADQ